LNRREDVDDVLLVDQTEAGQARHLEQDLAHVDGADFGVQVVTRRLVK
jgi:hypothetical protein